jgi:adenylate cyclase
LTTGNRERLGPRQVVEMLHTYLTEACEPILAQGGTADKFIGNAVMAIFGAPVPYPDHARRAVQAALELAQKAQEFHTWMKQRFGDLELPDFAVGIGLHTCKPLSAISAHPNVWNIPPSAIRLMLPPAWSL